MKEKGIDDESLIAIHREQLEAVASHERKFYYLKKRKRWVKPEDNDIITLIQSTPGQVVTSIMDNEDEKYKIAVVVNADHSTRGRALAEAYKVQGKYAPTKLGFDTEPITPAELTFVESLFKKNKK